MRVRRALTAAAGSMIVAAVVYLGVDTAGGNVSPTVAAALAAQNNQRVAVAATWLPSCSVGISVPSVARQNVVNLEASTLYTDVYGLVDSVHTGAQAMDIAYNAVTDNGADPDAWTKLDKVWVDYEIPGDCRPTYNVPWSTVLDALNELNRLGKPCMVAVPMEQIQCGVYTNRDNWSAVAGEPAWPDYVWAWIASWNGEPNLLQSDLFAGLNADNTYAKQYSGNALGPDVYVDYDSFFHGPTPVPPPTPTPEPTPMIVTWHAPPELRAGCYSGIVDARYGDWWNLCGNVWSFSDLSFFDPSTNTHYAANGVALQ